MLFNSYSFIFVFLPIALAGFALLQRFYRRWLPIIWLIGCSAVFYGYWSWGYLGLLSISLVVNYLIGAVWIPASSGTSRKTALVVGLTFNLCALSYFKYTNLIIQSFDAVTGSALPLRSIILPLGISFFTFQKIAYLVDSYKGRGYSRNFLHYCLFVMFFPQLIAGPIVHPREILPQFSRRAGFGITARNLSVGLTMFTFGLAKKVLVADTVASTASHIFSAAAAGTVPSLGLSWLAALSYALQIYFDFSGYSDMAIGLARLFGVRLPVNFNSPYQAVNIVEFWRRWHMTLSRFLRDYLYIPLGGNRRGRVRRYINLMVTMLLGGLWHGANWTFLVWGGLHGIYLIINHGWMTLRGRKASSPGTLPGKMLARAVTFLSVVVAWVFFRADNFVAAGRMLKGMAGCKGATAAEMGILHYHSNWMVVIVLLLFVLEMPNSQHVMATGRPALGVVPPAPGRRNNPLLWRPNKYWAIITAAMAIAAVLSLARASEFIYYQF